MPAKRRAKRDPIPKTFASPLAAGEFWDDHDLADYWDQTRAVADEASRIERRRFLIALEPTLARKLGKAARERGVSREALVNLWLSERRNAAAERPTQESTRNRTAP